MRYWLIIPGMGVVTFIIRASVIALFGRIDVPPQLRRSLRFVPPAVLTALITPALVQPAGILDLSPTNRHLVAGTLAALVAWKTKSTLLTIVMGMAVLWVLQMLR